MDLEYVIADVRHDLTEHFSSLVRSDATKVFGVLPMIVVEGGAQASHTGPLFIGF